MKTTTRLASLIAVLVALAGCATVTQAAPQQPGSTISIGGSARLGGQEASDAALLQQANAALNKGGYGALQPFLPGLRDALDHAPASYPAVETRSDGVMIVRADTEEDGMMLSLLAGVTAAGSGNNATVIQSPNVYPMVAMLLGSNAIEHGAFEEAHTYINRGLALQPDTWYLLSEKAAAYAGQQDYSAMLHLVDGALMSSDIMLATHRNTLLKKKGFALVELGRIEEAKAAYEEVLKDDPKDQTARSELQYINNLKSGAAPTDPRFVAPASKAGKQQ